MIPTCILPKFTPNLKKKGIRTTKKDILTTKMFMFILTTSKVHSYNKHIGQKKIILGGLSVLYEVFIPKTDEAYILVYLNCSFAPMNVPLYIAAAIAFWNWALQDF